MNNQLTILEENRPTLETLALAYMPLNATKEEAARRIVREVANIEQWIRTKPDLAAVIKEKAGQESLVYALKQCLQDGLSLAPNADLCYLIPGRVKVGENKYEWVINYEPTANGMLSMARQAGRILDHKRPVCTYNGENASVDSVTVEFLVPSYKEPRWESITFGVGHFKKWQTASANKNNGKANANYTSFNGGIDPEFAGTKAIIHGLNKRGMNVYEGAAMGGEAAASVSASQVPATEQEQKPEFHPYEEVKAESTQQQSSAEAPDLV